MEQTLNLEYSRALICWVFVFCFVFVFLFLFVPFDVVIFLHGECAVHDLMDDMADYSFYPEEITFKVLCNPNNIYFSIFRKVFSS